MANKIDGVARKAIRTVLHLHPRDAANEALFADTGLLAPSLLMSVSKLQWSRRVAKADVTRYISGSKTFCIPGRRRPGRPHAGTDWCKVVHTIEDNIKHALNVTSAFEAVVGQQPRARRSRRARVIRTPVNESSEANSRVDTSRLNISNNVWAAHMTDISARLYMGQPEARPSWYMDCVERLGNSRAQYLDVLPCRDARIVLAARCGRLCALEETWPNKSRGDLHVWTDCPRCQCALGGSVDACLHRIMFCPASTHATRWPEFLQVAKEVNVVLSHAEKCTQGDASREECCVFLADMLQPRKLSRDDAIVYWNAVVNVLKSQFTHVQVEEIEGDQGQGEDNLMHLHADFASQTPGVVNVHDVDAAMY